MPSMTRPRCSPRDVHRGGHPQLQLVGIVRSRGQASPDEHDISSRADRLDVDLAAPVSMSGRLTPPPGGLWPLPPTATPAPIEYSADVMPGSRETSAWALSMRISRLRRRARSGIAGRSPIGSCLKPSLSRASASSSGSGGGAACRAIVLFGRAPSKLAVWAFIAVALAGTVIYLPAELAGDGCRRTGLVPVRPAEGWRFLAGRAGRCRAAGHSVGGSQPGPERLDDGNPWPAASSCCGSRPACAASAMQGSRDLTTNSS
jgi:hypothetical protein